MVDSMALSLQRLECTFVVLSSAALRKWEQLWHEDESDAYLAHISAVSTLSTESAQVASLPWEQLQSALLSGVDAYMSAAVSSAAPAVRAAISCTTYGPRSPPFPVKLVEGSSIPALATDVRAAVDRMREVLTQRAAEMRAGVVSIAVSPAIHAGSVELIGASVFSCRCEPVKPGRDGELSRTPDDAQQSDLALLAPFINAVSVTRLLHGVGSPAFSWTEFKPAGYGRSRAAVLYGGGGGLWGKYADYAFVPLCAFVDRLLQQQQLQVQKL
jgi:hypothetical protein